MGAPGIWVGARALRAGTDRATDSSKLGGRERTEHGATCLGFYGRGISVVGPARTDLRAAACGVAGGMGDGRNQDGELPIEHQQAEASCEMQFRDTNARAETFSISACQLFEISGPVDLLKQMLPDRRQQSLIIGTAAGKENDDEPAACGDLDISGVVTDFAGVAGFRPEFRAGGERFAEVFFDLVLTGTRWRERALEPPEHGVAGLGGNGVTAHDPQEE